MKSDSNLFLEYQEKKRKVCDLAEAALKAGWLDEKTHNEILSKIKNDVLTIGVIGQMKCGKSTFLNSFLFGKPFLPAATTPMTAALSVITYGDKEEIIAEFYSQDEWNELKDLVQRDEEKETDLQTKSSIKAAKELYEKSAPIQSQIPSLLGKTQNDDFNNLIEYVGADGRYVPIVKSVKIYLSEEWLKGIEIVDTPGFNDPVISREERTKEFLKRADVVLMMLYAGRAFDATDRDILFDKVKRVGVGKIILAVNKYDIQLLRNESPEQIKGFVTDEIQKALHQYKEDTLSELLSDLEPILISAQLALLSKMPLSDIRTDADLKFHYDKACDEFYLQTQAQLYEKSNVAELENKVREIIASQKETILIKKTINLIFQSAKNIIDAIKKELLKLNQSKEVLSIPDDELEVRIKNLKKAEKKIIRKIEFAESDLSDAFDEISVKLFRRLQDMVEGVKDECNRIIGNYKRGELQRKLSDRIERFEDIELPRAQENVPKELRKSLNENLNQLSDDITDILGEYVDDSDEIVECFIRELKKKQFDIGVSTSCWSEEKEEDDDDGFSFGMLLALPVLPIAGIITLFSTGRDEAHEEVKRYFSSIDLNEIKDKFPQEKRKFLSLLHGENIKNLMKDLTRQAEEAQGSKEEKQKALEDVLSKISLNETKLEKINIEYKKLKELV